MSYFTTENLTKLGLNDEQIKKIFAERGKEMAKYNDYEEIKQKYKEQGERLNELQKMEPDKLKEQVDILTKNHKEQLKEMEKQHSETLKKMTVKMNLNDVYDPDIIMNLLDLNKIDIDENGNVKIGLDEQLENMRKEKSFLFKSDNTKVTGITPAEGDFNNESKINYTELLNEAREKGDNERAIRIINEASANGEYIR